MNRGYARLARAVEWRPVYGALRRALDLLLPFARLARRGEVLRVGAARA